jgi:hypothetical protein
MAKYKTITISADGREAYGLYDDRLGYRELGIVDAIRTTEVRMDKNGLWEIYLINEDKVLSERFTDRTDAINYEVAYIEDMVQRGLYNPKELFEGLDVIRNRNSQCGA